MRDKKILYLECGCGLNEHLVRFQYFEGDKWPEIYVDTCLCLNNPWYKRLWYGIKYIFGYRCRYGHFDETVLPPEQVRKLAEFVDTFRNQEAVKKYEKEWDKQNGKDIQN